MADQSISAIVRRNVLTCPPDLSLAAAAERMHANRFSSIVVVEAGRPVGIWTEADVLRVDFSAPAEFDAPIARVMSAPVKTIALSSSVTEAGLRFREEGVRHFVVVADDGAVAGVVSQSDVVLEHGIEHFLLLRTIDTAVGRRLVTIDGRTSLAHAVERMRDFEVDAALVTGDGLEPGIITERDLLRLMVERRHGVTVGAAASRPLVAMPLDTSLLAARNLLADKHIRHLAVTDAAGEITGLLSFRDILKALQYDYVLRLKEALRDRDDALLRSRKDLMLARKVIESSMDGIMISNHEGLIEFVNPAFSILTGYAGDEVMGKNPSILKSGRHDQAFYRDLWGALGRDDYWQGEIWNRRKNGEIYPEWLTINVLRDELGKVTQYAAIFSDITERKKTEERIKNLAYFDVLTGLPNRRLFTDRLSVALANAHRHSQRVAVMFIDLDLFKRINDTLGHGIGDRVLVETAHRLSNSVREGDTVARLGGDEFTVLLPEIGEPEDAAHMAGRIIDKVRGPFIVDGHELYVTSSVGIAIYPDDGTTVEVLVKNADTAMYRAKDMGRNSFQLYTPAMNARSFERLAMESSLRHALERRELRLVYQIKVDMGTGMVSGMEALVRWHHPEIGLVMPTEFIPLAENMGMISAIGEWVLREACHQNVAWQRAGLPPVRMAVNVSAHQFRDTDLVEVVARALADSGMAARHLDLELTESVLMQRVDEVAKVLADLRQLGVRIAVDDFGTGYSSLSYLKRMPIDALKVDRSFVKDVTIDHDDAEIVATIIAMAHNLRMRAVAEGVETPEQAAFLRRQGCDEIQGFLVGRPLAPADVIGLFNRRLLPAFAG